MQVSLRQTTRTTHNVSYIPTPVEEKLLEVLQGQERAISNLHAIVVTLTVSLLIGWSCVTVRAELCAIKYVMLMVFGGLFVASCKMSTPSFDRQTLLHAPTDVPDTVQVSSFTNTLTLDPPTPPSRRPVDPVE